VRSRTSRPHDVRTSRDRVARMLASQRKRGRIPALPKFRSGGALVDVADRDALYHFMESRKCSPSTRMCSTPPMRTRNFVPPAATGSSANGRDRVLGTSWSIPLRMTSHAQPYDVPHVGRRGISLQRFSPRRASQFLSRPNGSPTSPKRSLGAASSGERQRRQHSFATTSRDGCGRYCDSGIASRAEFE
jgi:hypothetical protein